MFELLATSEEMNTILLRFAIALAIGVLVGLQRQIAFHDPHRELVAGIRTYALIALLGAAGALAGSKLESPWPLLVFGIILGGYLALSYYQDTQQGDVGLTTEISALLVYIIGALCFWGYVHLGVALGVVTTLLLSLKLEMQRLANSITRNDLLAAVKFAIISAVILTVLPNRSFGIPPFDVFNPFKIWLLVVFISGLSFIGFVLMKLVGQNKGIWLTGLLGGLASSTAVTLSLSQQSKKAPELSRSFTLGIILAWSVMFVRVLITIYAVNPALVSLIWMPVAGATIAGVTYCVYLLLKRENKPPTDVKVANPFEIGPAVKFALLFVVILLISRAAQLTFGNAGVYLSSIVAGLADVDAISLSIAELSLEGGTLPLETAGIGIVIAALSNTFSKAVLVFIGGAAELRRALAPGFLLMFTVAAGLAFL